MRSCENCTKCCEGYLAGKVRDIPFYKGKPCHFVEIGVGCKIYEDRPKNPCIKYSCQWLIDENIPEWMKPSEINALVTLRLTKKNKIPYLELIEAGEPLRDDVILSLQKHCLKKEINFLWEKNEKTEYLGSDNFIKEMKEFLFHKNNKNKINCALIHVPKTAGSLIRECLDLYLCEHNYKTHMSSSYFNNKDHKHTFVTNVRDPYDRACSEYFQIKRQIEKSTKKNTIILGQNLETSIEDFLENFMKTNYKNDSVYLEYFDSMEVDDFDFVGNVHEMEKSIFLLNKIFSLNFPNVYINKNPNHNQKNQYNFKYSRKDFFKKNQTDYEIYYKGIDRFNNLCKKYEIF